MTEIQAAIAHNNRILLRIRQGRMLRLAETERQMAEYNTTLRRRKESVYPSGQRSCYRCDGVRPCRDCG